MQQTGGISKLGRGCGRSGKDREKPGTEIEQEWTTLVMSPRKGSCTLAKVFVQRKYMAGMVPTQGDIPSASMEHEGRITGGLHSLKFVHAH